MVEVWDGVWEPDGRGFEGWRGGERPRVPDDAVPYLPREVQPGAVVLEHLDDPQGLLGMKELLFHELRQHAFAHVTERRVAQVVTDRNGFGEIFVHAERAPDGARDL